MISAFLKGFVSGGGLIVAIGAQNAFVLSQGIRNNYILLIPFICFLCDVVFISLGISGIGRLAGSGKFFGTAISMGGALFLFFYGLGSFISAFKGQKLEEDHEKEDSLKKVVATTLAVTLLNPHFYLDTVFLMGSISSSFHGNSRFFFGSGAVTASFIWFFGLSIGASWLKPVFEKEISWRILDVLIGIIMWTIGFSLIRDLIIS